MTRKKALYIYIKICSPITIVVWAQGLENEFLLLSPLRGDWGFRGKNLKVQYNLLQQV